MMPRDDDDKREKRRCALRVLFARFLLSRVCPAARRELGWLMQMYRVQCVSIAPTYLYMLSGSVFSTATVYFCASCTENTRGSLFKEREREGGPKERGTSSERQPLASKFHRSLYITLPPCTRHA